MQRAAHRSFSGDVIGCRLANFHRDHGGSAQLHLQAKSRTDHCCTSPASHGGSYASVVFPRASWSKSMMFSFGRFRPYLGKQFVEAHVSHDMKERVAEIEMILRERIPE